MKLTGILACGTYYSPWTPYTIASIYKLVDELIIVNGGYSISNPNPEVYNVPLKQVTRDIEHLDVDGKVIEVKNFSMQDLEHKAPLITQIEANKRTLAKTGDVLIWTGNWFDLRGLNLTLANEIAVKRGADMILKIDSDQVCYKDVIGLKSEGRGLTLYQYEFAPDLFHLAEPSPSSPFSDSVFTYEAKKGQWYAGGGAPVIYADREPNPKYHCAHLRYANPPFLSDEEKFQHFRDRSIFHLFTNEYGKFCEELFKRAENGAREGLKRKGFPSNVSPPECTLTDPLVYIQEMRKLV